MLSWGSLMEQNMSHLRPEEVNWKLETLSGLFRACLLLQAALFLPIPSTKALHVILLIIWNPQEAVSPPFLGIPFALRLFSHALSYMPIETSLCSIPYLPRPQLPLRTTQANIFMQNKWTQCVWLLSRVWHLATLWTVAHQAPLSMGFSRREYWSELPFSCSRGSFRPRDRTQVSCISGIACGFFTRWAIWEAH